MSHPTKPLGGRAARDGPEKHEDRAGPGEYATVWQLEEVGVAMADPDVRRLLVGWTGLVGDDAVAWMEGSTVERLA
jgi:hypothetical protein